MIYELSFRGAGGAVVPGLLTEYGSTNATIRGERVLASNDQVVFIIHGFNVEESEGRTSLSRLADLLDHEDSATVFVLWPGDSPIGPLSYPFTEGHQANDTAAQLMRFIESQVGDATTINFVAHSLGCRVALETVQRLFVSADGEKSVYPIGQLCLMAAAVDDFSLSIPQKYKFATERADRVVVLSSVEDEILRFIYPVGDLVQAFLFFWKESAGAALGYRGPRVMRVRSRDPSRSRDKALVYSVGSNVYSIEIDKDHKVDHGDYLPPGDSGKPENKAQRAAAGVTRAALAGESELAFRM